MFNRVGSCKEFVRRNTELPNMQSAVRSLFGELWVSYIVWGCKEFIIRIARYLI